MINDKGIIITCEFISKIKASLDNNPLDWIFESFKENGLQVAAKSQVMNNKIIGVKNNNGNYMVAIIFKDKVRIISDTQLVLDEYAYKMFAYTKIKTLDLREVDMGYCKNTEEMFGWANIECLKIDMSKVRIASNILYCSEIGELDLYNLNPFSE